MSAILERDSKVDKSKWIALSQDNKVLAEDVDPNILIKLLEEKQIEDYILQYVPDPNRSYIF